MKYDEIFVKAPFSPVDLVCENNEAEFKLWGRSYKMDNHSPLFASVISQDEEILASPIRIVMEENGAPSNWCDTKIIPLDEEAPSSKTLLATTASDAFYINTATTVEFDGFTKVQLKVMPRGLSVKEIFLARENKREVKFELDKLWVEIPVKKSSAIFYQVYPRCAVKNSKGETVKENSPLSTGDSVHKGTACFPFCAQFFVSGEKSGIGFVAENAKNWQSVSKDRVIECVDEGEVVLIRIRLLDSHPASWVHRGMSDVNCFTPLSFSFGFQVTPVKQFPKNPYIERNVHIDCFKKIEGDYEKYLSQEFIKDDGTKTGENGFDRLKRLGVNTLYLHEKWNDIQNSTLLTKASADRLSFIVDECHKRNIKVIPYFGYEISSLSPEWGERMEEICVKTKEGIAKGMWNRVPYQRCVHVCCNSSVLESFPRGIGALMDRFGFDGVYLDGTATPWDCANTDHGCGYIDQEGKLRPGYPVWAARDMLMAIYKVVHSRGGTINYHTAGSYNLSSLSLCDSIWEGEVTQFAFLNDTIASMPEGIYRAQFDGRIFGLPIFMLAYTDAPKWTHEHSTALALLLGTVHKPNDLDEPLESTSRIWSLIDELVIDESLWHPYWKDNSLVNSNCSRVKVSYYQNKNHLLVFSSNVSNLPAENVVLSAKGKFIGKINTNSKTEFSTIPESFEGFGYRVYFVELY